MINSLGSFVQDQLGLLGWSRVALVERSGLDEWELEGILESPVLVEWPSPQTLLALAKVFSVSVHDIVIRAAEGAGLHVAPHAPVMERLSLVPNDALMREVRRRLALGAATGGYLATPAAGWNADSGAQLT